MTGPTKTFDEIAHALVAVGRSFHARGWAPATAGNYSAKLADGRVAITVSGAHKGRLTPSDIMILGEDPRRPSAETALHLAVYRAFPEAGAVLHSHAAVSVALGRAISSDSWTIAGHELLKALPGVATHEVSIAIPIVDNSQDMAEIEAAVMPRLGAAPAYLIRGHGLYGWGRDIAEAERVVEALEWLAEAELAERRFRA
jgi:methylthioribulose-1-phosphate dehydratase